MKPPLFDPDKTYVVIKYGEYTGRYPVYHSLIGFKKAFPELTAIAPWWKAERGDWIMTDDGCITQVIRTYWLGNPKKRKRLTKVVRVSWTSAPYYERLDGTTASRLVFRRKKAQSAASMAQPGTGKHGKHWNSKKKYFAWLVVAKDLAPYQAYMMAFKTVSIRAAKTNSRYLMKEDRLLREVADIYKKLFDAAGMTDEDIASQIADIAKVNTSGKVRLDALRLALELRGEAPAGNNLNVRFPQLPGGQSGAMAPTATAGTLTAPARQLQGRSVPDAMEVNIEAESDMQEAEVVPAESATAEMVTAEMIINDVETYRLPNGEILATDNPRYLEMQQGRSMEKLEWARREKLIVRQKGETIVTKE